MRIVAVCLAMTLAACATMSEPLPRLRYADAASRGTFASVLAGRPSAAQVDAETQAWSIALSDSIACELPTRHVVNAAFVGALEVSAMNAAATSGDQRQVREGVGLFLAELMQLMVERTDRPSDIRCAALSRWAPRVADEGRDAVERARRNGLMGDTFLLDLLSR
jgi:hypothetical protein